MTKREAVLIALLKADRPINRKDVPELVNSGTISKGSFNNVVCELRKIGGVTTYPPKRNTSFGGYESMSRYELTNAGRDYALAKIC